MAQNEKLQREGTSWLAQGHLVCRGKDNSLTRAIQKALNLLKGKDVWTSWKVLTIPRAHQEQFSHPTLRVDALHAASD